jgi:adenylylsulfate kinase
MFAQVADSAPDEHWILAGTFYKRRFWTPFERLDGVVVVHLHADLETCLARNRRREAPIDETGVHVVWREFDPPDADLRVDVTDLSPRAVVDRVVAALEALPDDVRPAGLARRDG